MKEFDQNEFLQKLTPKLVGFRFQKCPYCGGERFTTTNEFASIVVSKSFEGLQIGNAIPAGMVICQNCGHIEFFALGALQMLPKKEDDKDGKK